MNDDTLANYLGNFIHGFDDATQRRHLRKRGWIEYMRKSFSFSDGHCVGRSWNLTQEGRREATARGFLASAEVLR